MSQDTTVDTSEDQVYNSGQLAADPNEELQARYIEALESGDKDKIATVESEINALFGKKPEEPEPEETPPPHGTEEAKTTEQPETEKPAKEGGTSETEDWLESLDPKVRDLVLQRLDQERKAREYHEQKYKSDIGRITAYKEKYENERKAREQLEQKLASTPANPPVSDNRTPAQVNSDNAKLKALNEQIGNLERTDPELATSLKTLRDAFLEEIANRATPTQPVIDPSILDFKREFEQQKAELTIERERYELERRVPGALQVIDYVDQRGWSPWQEFLTTLPPQFQAAANEPSADAYEALMRLYIPWAERYNAAHGYTQQPSPNNEPPKSAQSEVDPRAAQVQANRQSKMVSSTAAAPVKSSPPPAGRGGNTIEELIQSAAGLDPDSPEYMKIMERAYALAEKGGLK